MRFRLSILDRANIRHGHGAAEALIAAVARAQRAEVAGFERFWVAEHHAVPGIAGSAPVITVATIAASTDRIRVGSGGVMLPSHVPFVVAEQFATLEALHPGRIDLGLGRSLGFTPAVRAALRQDTTAADRFEEDVRELIGFLRGTSTVTARPENRGTTPLFVLATGSGITLAARLGLPVVVGGPALRRHDVLERYREAFRPSAQSPEPEVIAAVNVMVADTDARARDLLLPEAWAMAMARTRGDFPPLLPVDDVRAQSPTTRQRSIVEDVVAASVHGTPDRVAEQLDDLAEQTGAAEVMVTGATYDREAQAASDTALGALVAAARRTDRSAL